MTDISKKQAPQTIADTEKLLPQTVTDNVLVKISAIKEALKTRLAPYEGLVLSSDQITEGKKIVADLNKEKKIISDRRISVMRDHTSKADPFKDGMKEVEDMYDTATADMKKQITESETKRKAEAAEKLSDFLLKEWDKQGVEQEYRNASVDGLASLTAITTKGNPTAKIASEIVLRVSADRTLQERTSMRLLRLENESYKAGLHAPLTRNHVESFLFADDERYAIELDRIIAAEIERQKATEERIEQRQKDQDEAEKRRQAAAPQPEQKAMPEPAPVAEAAPVATPVAQQRTAPQANTRPVTVVCTFNADVPASATEAQVERSITKQLEAKGFTSLSSVKATFNSQQDAA